MPESRLPEGQKTIGLNPVRELAEETSYERLASAVDATTRSLASLKADAFPSHETPPDPIQQEKAPKCAGTISQD